MTGQNEVEILSKVTLTNDDPFWRYAEIGNTTQKSHFLYFDYIAIER